MKKLVSLISTVALLCGICAEGAKGQLSNTPQQSKTQFLGWDSTKSSNSDVTLTAAIERGVTNGADGSHGSEIVVTTAQGALKVSIGPFMAKDFQQKLSAGTQVQMTGKIASANGETYLLAKDILVNGQQFKIRNEHGGLIRGRQHTGALHLQSGESK